MNIDVLFGAVVPAVLKIAISIMTIIICATVIVCAMALFVSCVKDVLWK